MSRFGQCRWRYGWQLHTFTGIGCRMSRFRQGQIERTAFWQHAISWRFRRAARPERCHSWLSWRPLDEAVEALRTEECGLMCDIIIRGRHVLRALICRGRLWASIDLAHNFVSRQERASSDAGWWGAVKFFRGADKLALAVRRLILLRCFSRAHEHWQKDVNFELHCCVPIFRNAIFVGWTSTELLALPPADHVSNYVMVKSLSVAFEVPGMFSVLSPYLFSYYDDYVQHGLLLRLNIVWQIHLWEYIVFNVISFLTTAWDALAAMRERDGRMPDSAESVVSVPWPSQLVRPLE